MVSALRTTGSFSFEERITDSTMAQKVSSADRISFAQSQASRNRKWLRFTFTIHWSGWQREILVHKEASLSHELHADKGIEVRGSLRHAGEDQFSDCSCDGINCGKPPTQILQFPPDPESRASVLCAQGV